MRHHFGINNPINSERLVFCNFNNRADYSSNAIYYHAYMALLNQVAYHTFKQRSKWEIVD